MIYLDHAATSPLRAEARAAMAEFEDKGIFANPSSGHSMGREADAVLEESRRTLAGLLQADPVEMYFTSGGTESDNWAILGTAAAFPEKRHIISTSIEHHAVLHTLDFLKQLGYTVDLIDPDPDGLVSAAAVLK